MIAETMRRTVHDLLAASERERITPRKAAEAVAERNLDELEREFPATDGRPSPGG